MFVIVPPWYRLDIYLCSFFELLNPDLFHPGNLALWLDTFILFSLFLTNFIFFKLRLEAWLRLTTVAIKFRIQECYLFCIIIFSFTVWLYLDIFMSLPNTIVFCSSICNLYILIFCGVHEYMIYTLLPGIYPAILKYRTAAWNFKYRALGPLQGVVDSEHV